MSLSERILFNWRSSFSLLSPELCRHLVAVMSSTTQLALRQEKEQFDRVGIISTAEFAETDQTLPDFSRPKHVALVSVIHPTASS